MEINSQSINSQKLFFLTINDWKELLKNGNLGNINVQSALFDLINRDINLMELYPELQLVIGNVGGKFWLPYMLLDLNSSWQRISIEIKECSNCKWIGYTGLPDSIDSYIGIPKEIDKFQLIKETKKIPSVKCPKCNSEFKDHIVWIDSMGLVTGDDS